MKTKFGIIFGSLLFIIAIVLILTTTGTFPSYTNRLLISWQALIILVGLVPLLTKQYYSGAIITLIGGYYLIPYYYSVTGIPSPVNQSTLTTLLVAALLIILGIGAIRIGKRCTSHRKPFFEIKPNKKGLPEISCAFGETSQAIIEKPFKGAIVSTAFGQMILNLSKTTLPEGDSYLEVKNAFGNTIVIVPSSWAVESSVQSFLGTLEDKRNNPPHAEDRRLILKGANAFGSIQIQNVQEDITGESTAEETIDSISVKQNNRVHIISLDELLYIQAEGDYVTLCTTQGNFLKEQTMKYFQNALPTNKFVCIHRSYIVNLTEISAVDCRGKEVYYVILKNGTALRTSTTGYQELKQKLEI